MQVAIIVPNLHIWLNQPRIFKGYVKHLDKIRTRTSPAIQAQAVRALIGRLLPERVEEFNIKIEPGLIGEENGYFQVELCAISPYSKINLNVGLQIKKTAESPSVSIKGSTGVMAAWVFHYYLTQFCRCQVSWDADQLNIPFILPEASVRISSLDK